MGAIHIAAIKLASDDSRLLAGAPSRHGRATRASHMVTLLRTIDLVERRAASWREPSDPRHGRHRRATRRLYPPGRGARRRTDRIRAGWNRSAPLVMHCYAGISRSTAGASSAPARSIRNATSRDRATDKAFVDDRDAQSDAVAHADRILGARAHDPRRRGDRPGRLAQEGDPFRLDLE